MLVVMIVLFTLVVMIMVVLIIAMGGFARQAYPGQFAGCKRQGQRIFPFAFFQMHHDDGVIAGIGQEDVGGLPRDGHGDPAAVARGRRSGAGVDSVFHMGMFAPVPSHEEARHSELKQLAPHRKPLRAEGVRLVLLGIDEL